MNAKEFSAVSDAVEKAIKRIERLRDAEMCISTNGNITIPTKMRLGVSWLEIDLTMPAVESGRHHRIRRGHEMIALGLKKVLQGMIADEELYIEILRYKLMEVTKP